MALIMVADDDPVILAMIRGHLESLGHQVVTVSDGMQAAEKAQDWRPHLIITDIQMPNAYGTTAYEVLQRSAATVGVPVIFISGVPEALAQKLLPKAVGVRFLPKPLDLVRLDALVRELLPRA